eukprot:TRINITY_DN14758_c0_g2_i2.p1 TRINITY_DN14758_c0_g2~~TRINITY_DN14758_c0_g2_i2.p1  ORF type:complete len:306 (-),score=27.44 TRINITY_DN14758_c0_g2_i2:212-1129(-)
MYCNGCWSELEAQSQAVATACKHVFCIKCAEAMVESDSTCSVCDSLITTNTIKLIKIGQDLNEVKMNLCGMSVEAIVQAFQYCMLFNQGQQELLVQYKEAKLKQRMVKMQEGCKKKLAEVHNGFQQAKKKYQEAQQQNMALQKDLQELQQKYSQKAVVVRNLQEMAEQLKQENTNLRRKISGKSTHSNLSGSPHRMHTNTNKGFGMRNNEFNQDLNFDNLGMFNVGSSFHGVPGMQPNKRRGSIVNPNAGVFKQESFLPGTSPPSRTRQSLGKSTKQQKPSGTLKQLLQGQQTNLPGSPSGLASF